jgi:hypothetical protein
VSKCSCPKKLLKSIAPVHILEKGGVFPQGRKQGKKKPNKPIPGTAQLQERRKIPLLQEAEAPLQGHMLECIRSLKGSHLPARSKAVEKHPIPEAKGSSGAEKVIADNQFAPLLHQLCSPMEKELPPGHMEEGLDGVGKIKRAFECGRIGKITRENGAAFCPTAPVQQTPSRFILDGTDGNAGEPGTAESCKRHHAAPDPAANIQNRFSIRSLYTSSDEGVNVIDRLLPGGYPFAPEGPVNRGAFPAMTEKEESGGVGIIIAFNITPCHTWLIREPG